MIRRACLAALLSLSASTAFGASTYDHLYAFGDSYSDNGAGEALTTQLAAQNIEAVIASQPTQGAISVKELATQIDVPDVAHELFQSDRFE